MRPSLLITFLLFVVLVSQVQGIRLNKGFKSHDDQIIQKDVITRTSDNGADVEVMNLKDEHISGDTKKLMAKATSNFPTISKNDENRPKSIPKKIGSGGKDESLSVDSTLGSEHTGQYPDIIDLTGMDYSPAKRKPPIHN